jgi:flagellar protein FliO/FliZ
VTWLILAFHSFAAETLDESSIALNLPKVATIQANQSEFSTRYFMGLAIVAIFLAVGIFVIKRLNKLTPRKHGLVKMKVLNQLPLGAKKHLAVIEVAGEQILIGVTDHHISMIKSLSLLDEDISEISNSNFKAIASEVDASSEIEKKFKDFTEEEFTISKTKNLIKDKIKTMRPM